MRWNAAWTTAD